MTAQVNDAVAPVDRTTHPFTYNCQFYVPENTAGLITVDGFRNLLEAHIGSLNPTKRDSYTRNRAWLTAIRDCDTTIPIGYKGTRASWKNEIGATNPNTSKWVIDDNKVFKKDTTRPQRRADQPMTPTENIYAVMIEIHRRHGHRGRDFFFERVKECSDSIKKAFCHQFVQVCCDKAPSWQVGGNVSYGWQAPVNRRSAASRQNERPNIDNINSPDDMDAAGNIQYLPTPPHTQQKDGQQVDDTNMVMDNLDDGNNNIGDLNYIGDNNDYVEHNSYVDNVDNASNMNGYVQVTHVDNNSNMGGYIQAPSFESVVNNTMDGYEPAENLMDGVGAYVDNTYRWDDYILGPPNPTGEYLILTSGGELVPDNRTTPSPFFGHDNFDPENSFATLGPFVQNQYLPNQHYAFDQAQYIEDHNDYTTINPRLLTLPQGQAQTSGSF